MCLSVKQQTKTFPVINLMIQKANFFYIYISGRMVPGSHRHIGSLRKWREKAETNILFCMFENNVCITVTSAVFSQLESV